MLGNADTSIAEALRAFSEFGVEPGFIVPTKTGIEKSIMDAHQGLRRFFQKSGIHNFDSQGFGALENGIKIPVTLLTFQGEINQELSLYRPKTKSGDPRIWTNIRKFANPNNLLAFFLGESGRLYLVNCSDQLFFETRHISGSHLYAALQSAGDASQVSKQLLSLLKSVAARGWIDATKTGDTAVGHTLESALGIKANSSKLPDYLGQIELKSGRVGSSGQPGTRKHKSKKSLFSKVPNWDLSPLTAGEILKRFGSRDDTGRLNLSVTVSNKPNRQGLFVFLDEKSGHILGKAKSGRADEVIVVWNLEDLQSDLGKKHRETFWVEAETRFSEGKEQFKFTKVHHTKKPLLENLGILLSEGIITMDFTLSEKKTGGVRDHGYLFRIDPKNLGLLFPSIQTYEL